jgi:hypothetical protein
MIEYHITEERLEKLKEVSKINENGLSNFKIVENKDGEEHFIFRIVCERVIKVENELSPYLEYSNALIAKLKSYKMRLDREVDYGKSEKIKYKIKLQQERIRLFHMGREMTIQEREIQKKLVGFK